MPGPDTAHAGSRAGRLGVGILGAGPVTQAIHLPTLARLTETFEVTVVMDVDAAVAESVAGRVGAEFTTSAEALFNHPRVDVIAICSPHQFHAQQVIDACRARVKAVLCEKPFAMSREEATAIAEVSAETRVPIIVGAMHTFDPGWLAAAENWGDLAESAHMIRSTIVLPPNSRFEDVATEVIARPEFDDDDLSDSAVAAAALNGGVMGLAIHDLPLIRQFLPTFDDFEIMSADVARPFGYAIVGRAAGRTIELQAAMTDTWRPEWTVEAFSSDRSLRVTFTPSYVQGGSAVAELRTADGVQILGPYSANGYQGEWEFLARLARREVAPIPPDRLIDDLRFALVVADAAAEFRLRKEAA